MNQITETQSQVGIQIFSRWLDLQERLEGLADRVDNNEDGLTGSVVLLVGMAIAGVAAVAAISAWINTKVGELP